MRHFYNIIIILLLFAFTACRQQESSSFLEEEDVLLLQRPYCNEFNVNSQTSEILISFICNTDWIAATDVSWIELSSTNGTGTDTISACIRPNPASQRREAVISISFRQDQNRQLFYHVSQAGRSTLLSIAGYEKGAGFAYDYTCDYCKGMTWQIFDVEALDYYQYLPDTSSGEVLKYGLFVTDNIEAYGEEQYVAGTTLAEIEQQLSASASLDLDSLKVVDVNVTGNVYVSDLEKEETVFGMKRTKRIVLVRDIQYLNCVAAAKAGLKEVFAPGFYSDWENLEYYDGNRFSDACNAFLDKWGVAFVCRSCLGGSLDYEMEISKETLGTTITIEAALDAEVGGGILNADGKVEWKEIRERLKNGFSADLHVYGGDVKLVSIIADRSGSLASEQLNSWLNSISCGKQLEDPLLNNAVLVDVKIASIANLFTGDTRLALEKLIAKRINQ